MRLKITTLTLKLSTLFLVSTLLISGCLEPKPPQEIARCFWDAVEAKETDTAHKYTTISSYGTIDLLEERFTITNIRFGKILIDGDKTTIETTIQILRDSSDGDNVPIQTILVKEKGLWKVDYAQTKATLSLQFSFEEMLNNIRLFGNNFSENIEKSLEELKHNMPEIEKKLDELSTTAAEKIREAWEQYLPEIKKKVEEFGTALEKALKNGSRDPKEPPPQKNHQSDDYITF
ncbi:MAG: hypothetical protein EX341_16695 [Candidatus Scalindua sp. SCAELEC01]|nr:hypothetical protein [Planctomycetota bacterium]RZV68035.1 MAG: hypothetical protein EX341_16695 [Candidatus Scalindua sp. SCAELEC01]